MIITVVTLHGNENFFIPVQLIRYIQESAISISWFLFTLIA